MTEAEWLTSTDPAAMLAAITDRTDSGRPRITDRASDRKLRLFACACCRLVWGRLTDARSRRAVEVAERFADGLATEEEQSEATMAAHAAWGQRDNAAGFAVRASMLDIAYGVREITRPNLIDVPPPAAQAALLRDVFGNPYRLRSSIQLPLSCFSPNVLALAAAAYGGEPCDGCYGQGELTRHGGNPNCCICAGSGRTPFNASILPILADALEDAGCADQELLRHLHGRQTCTTCNGGKGRKQCKDCFEGDRPLPTPHVLGCWALDLILGKS